MTETLEAKGEGAKAPRRGWLFRLFWPVTSYLVTNVTVTLFGILVFVLNRTTVIGRHHVGEQPNTLLLSNHQSMLDSFLVGMGAFYPQSWLKPHLMPWNPAAAENFYKNPILAWLADNWKCISVREGRRDLHALHRMTEVLPDGVMTLFPRVIPVAIEGMRDVLPIGSHVPRVGKRVYVSYGAPIDYSEFLTSPRTREVAQALMDRVMDAIRAQQAELRLIRSRTAGT
jgi:1-acyl-sn-glycerol-3-phosphate acyltransferase